MASVSFDISVDPPGVHVLFTVESPWRQVPGEPQLPHSAQSSGLAVQLQPCPGQTQPSSAVAPAPACLPIIPIGSMPGGLPGIDRSPGVVLVPGVGASFLGVGVLDLSPGVEDLSF